VFAKEAQCWHVGILETTETAPGRTKLSVLSERAQIASAPPQRPGFLGVGWLARAVPGTESPQFVEAGHGHLAITRRDLVRLLGGGLAAATLLHYHIGLLVTSV
jgi:hypothetical protein